MSILVEYDKMLIYKGLTVISIFVTLISDNSYFVPQFVKMLDKPIDVDEIKKAALKLKNGKSVGIDLISNEMIKCCVDSHFVRLIRKLFNFILVESKVPSC